MASVVWFRRDLRIGDHPAISAAAHASSAGRLVGLFVLDPVLWRDKPSARQEWLRQSLVSLDASLGGNLLIVRGRPADVVPAVAAAAGAASVHISADFGSYGMRRDAEVSQSLAAQGIALIADGSPYAVDPGLILTQTGTRYRVFTPYYRAWARHGWQRPDPGPARRPQWFLPEANAITAASMPAQQLPGLAPGSPWAVGETAALKRWQLFVDSALSGYRNGRDLPALDGTSGLSASLRFGEVHPRTLLADLADAAHGDAHGDAAASIETFRKELAWREFYADVWDENPGSSKWSLDGRFDSDLELDKGAEAEAKFLAWTQGATGYPFVDAGMRQLRAEGWMHNRLRMITASFLVKSLHLPWQDGAAWFFARLRDGDAASNQHGWQWTAGCGTDAAPFHRIFNPLRQGLAFDPDGDYVRRWIPELSDFAGASAHEPWKSAGTLGGPDPRGYPDPIVDLKAERDEALRRFRALPPRS